MFDPPIVLKIINFVLSIANKKLERKKVATLILRTYYVTIFLELAGL